MQNETILGHFGPFWRIFHKKMGEIGANKKTSISHENERSSGEKRQFWAILAECCYKYVHWTCKKV
jgi:hypothetical protein